jgi:hypothetical protein
VEPLISVKRSPRYRKFSLLWSALYKHAGTYRDGERTSVKWNVTPLVGYQHRKNHLDWRVTPLVRVNRTPKHDRLSLFWRMLYYRRTWSEAGEHKRTRASGLLGTVRHEWDVEYARTSVLKYLYRRERRGEEIARDIFPFVSWDSAPEGGKVSLLWRLLSVEREGDKRGGHILFIPWGDEI